MNVREITEYIKKRIDYLMNDEERYESIVRINELEELQIFIDEKCNDYLKNRGENNYS